MAHLDDRLAAQRPGPVAVLYIDVDRLKSINDYLGHCAGDWFIRVFAQRLRVKVGCPGVIARIGADEFVFVPNQPMSANDAQSFRALSRVPAMVSPTRRRRRAPRQGAPCGAGRRGLSLELEDGTVSKARRVILATGHMSFRNVPDELKGLPDGMCLHSTALHDLRQFAGRDVTVIGAGQSALESLAPLHEAGAKTRLVARRKQITWNPLARPNPNLIERLRTPEAGLGAG
jgi:GGDEF domain-containing protein